MIPLASSRDSGTASRPLQRTEVATEWGPVPCPPLPPDPVVSHTVRLESRLDEPLLPSGGLPPRFPPGGVTRPKPGWGVSEAPRVVDHWPAPARTLGPQRPDGLSAPIQGASCDARRDEGVSSSGVGPTGCRYWAAAPQRPTPKGRPPAPRASGERFGPSPSRPPATRTRRVPLRDASCGDDGGRPRLQRRCGRASSPGAAQRLIAWPGRLRPTQHVAGAGPPLRLDPLRLEDEVAVGREGFARPPP
eukprot:CAMPEP_0197433206 /NCGR_PEP_ID=MMETSP1175-20131217/1123_1 /TAXON_ID=1003142 /ORGANISM="Triceratium dubium, Strain CCMP147" /LENGTH=246 /DNA_ID=CAMNT_0042961515 /DNA_START=331 /DNA_END=1073 /DNA_ORIENTATION=+